MKTEGKRDTDAWPESNRELEEELERDMVAGSCSP